MLTRGCLQPFVRRLLITGIYTGTFFAIIFCLTSVLTAPASADEATSKTAETDPEYAVPDGTPDEINEFIEKLQRKRPRFANRQEQIDHAIKVQKAFISAGNKIIDQSKDDEVVEKAVAMKLNALMLLASAQIPGAAKEALDAITVMKKDSREVVSSAAAARWTTVRIFSLPDLNEEDRRSLIEEVITTTDKKRFDRSVIQDVMQLGRVLEETGDPKEAAAYYTKIADLAEHQGTPQLRDLAERMRGTARRVSLPGNEMEINAKLLNGDDFDWASYRGKVVLVDFWATWCGPCIGELPNVKANYAKYHDKGFEVVGISLDRDQEKLSKFIEEEKLPWAQLFDEEIQKGVGWNHPVARHYGISSIPAVILVDRDGKVVSMRARGPELGKLLEKLLGKTE